MMISYAQNLEDVVLNRVFHDVVAGQYIDIGAYDPFVDSVTKHFYDRGWSGINVEAVERFHEKFVRDRPRDRNINAVIGDHVGSVVFNEWGESGWSTYREQFDPSVATSLGFVRTQRQVQMTTLAEITADLGGVDIQFLKIDVEGAERDVLLGAEWRSFRPRVILIEAIKPKMPGCDPYGFEPTWFEWEGLLFENGYEFGLFDGLNRFYYRREEPQLRPLLIAPANTTDGFKLCIGHGLTQTDIEPAAA